MAYLLDTLHCFDAGNPLAVKLSLEGMHTQITYYEAPAPAFFRLRRVSPRRSLGTFALSRS